MLAAMLGLALRGLALGHGGLAPRGLTLMGLILEELALGQGGLTLKGLTLEMGELALEGTAIMIQ